MTIYSIALAIVQSGEAAASSGQDSVLGTVLLVVFIVCGLIGLFGLFIDLPRSVKKVDQAIKRDAAEHEAEIEYWKEQARKQSERRR